MIPLSVPNISGNEWKYVKECLDTGWVSYAGSYVERFEQEFAKYIGCKYAIATTSGTAALHISLILSGVEQNDEVLVPNLTFVATANAVRYCSANPVFMDSEWGSLGLDVQKVSDFLKNECHFKNGSIYNKKTGARIRAIIPMHTLGYPVDMDPLIELCNKYNITAIEDATESLGSKYKGKNTGNLGTLGCFSFNGNKIITTGGGGMITTDDEKIARSAKHLTTTAKTNPVEYDHNQVGYNYRLTNILAALGVAQLERIDEFIEVKRNNWELYADEIDKIPGFDLHKEPEHVSSNYWMYCLIKQKENSVGVLEMVEHFAQYEIQVRPIWKLMNMLPMFKNHQSYFCDRSVDMHNRILNIPSSTNLTKSDIGKVLNVIQLIAM